MEGDAEMLVLSVASVFKGKLFSPTDRVMLFQPLLIAIPAVVIKE